MPRVLAGRYTLDELVAVGGSSDVHRGTDLVLERPVAVKVLDVARVETADPSARRRFAREARTSARFTHPNAVSVYDAGEDGDVLYLVLEYVDGETLAHRLASGSLPVHEAVHVTTQVLAALEAAHTVGIIHRDVKPANILLRPDGVAKLADFGIAQRFDDISDVLTAAGTVVGTPRYLAPEQARGDALSPATDLYAVGVVLYEMLAGQVPSTAGAAAPSAARVDADLLALRRARTDVPDHVVESISRALHPEPAARHADAAAMAESLAHRPSASDAAPAAATAAVVPPAAAPPTVVAPAPAPAPAAPVGPTRVARRGAVPPRPRRRGRGLLAALVVVAIVLVAIAVVSAWNGSPLDDATASSVPAAPTTAVAATTTLPPLPTTLEELLAGVAANPAAFGPRGDDLVAGLQAVLAETDDDDRAEVADALAVAVEQWAAGGEIDQGVATIALHLLEPVRVAGDDGTGGGAGNGNGKSNGKGKGNGGDD